MSVVQIRLWPPVCSKMVYMTMLKIFLPLLFIVFLSPASAGDKLQNAPSNEHIQQMPAVLQAMFLSQKGEHAKAAQLFAALGERLNSAALLREAYYESLGGRNVPQSLGYARRWHELSGEAEALSEQARILLLTGKQDPAAEILHKLVSSNKLTNEELAKLLRNTTPKHAAALGRALFADTTESNIYLARLAIDIQDVALSKYAIERGIAHGQNRDEFFLLSMREQKLEGGALGVLAESEKYLKAGCPDATACDEQSLLYAFVLYEAGRDEEWREALHGSGGAVDEAALYAGRFLEGAELTKRAVPYYEKVQERFFRARLGLARIHRDEGRLEEALAILESSPVVDDRELVLREVTASDIVEQLHGAEAAVKRIARALRSVPNNESLMYQQALLMEEAGNVNEAVLILEKMTQLFPRSADTWNALGYVLADNNLQLNEAEQYIKIALKLQPMAPNILDSLGWVYYRQGRLEEARKYLLDAAERSNSSEIFTHLGEVHWQLGDFTLARQAFADAKKHDPENKVLYETLQRLQVTE